MSDTSGDKRKSDGKSAKGSAVSKRAKNSQTPSPATTFLSLPPEIRLRIYGYFFKRSRPIYPHIDGLQVPPNNLGNINAFPRDLIIGMTHTNKQLSGEVAHFLYNNNRFRLSLAHHRDWINRIGRKNSNALKEVILVGEGRVQAAATQLSAMMTTLWKRAPDSLCRITVHDEWYSLDSAFILRELLKFGNKHSWKAFRSLEEIVIDIPHRTMPGGDRTLYKELCLQARVNVTARYCVQSWTRRPSPLTPNGWLPTGTTWFRVLTEELESSAEEQVEQGKKTAKQKKDKKRREKSEKRP